MDLNKFLSVNHLKQIEIADYLGVTRSYVSRLMDGKAKLNRERWLQLLNNPHGWDTSMLQDVDTRQPIETSSTPRIPVIPFDVKAGALSDYSEGVMPYQCEQILSPFATASCAIRVYGDSMESRYPSGSLLFLQRQDPEAFIEWGRPYVLDTTNGAVVKIVMKTDQKDTIQCVSLNPKYLPFEVNVTHIRGWYKVIGVLIAE